MEQFDQYKAIRELGVGASGVVYECIDLQTDRRVAIKILHEDLTQNFECLSRFENEAKTLARLNHPNIATLYTTSLHGRRKYLVMEMVDGVSIDDLLRRQGHALPLRESLAIVAQVADGLTYAHKNGVYHRDIKPANIMLARDGRAKILDFGLAVVRDRGRITQDGAGVGTPNYMPPEQWVGGASAETSDQFSLAATLYEMITGVAAFPGDRLDRVLSGDFAGPPRPSSLVREIPSKIDNALLKALSPKPSMRFSNIPEFQNAIGAVRSSSQPETSALFDFGNGSSARAKNDRRSGMEWNVPIIGLLLASTLLILAHSYFGKNQTHLGVLGGSGQILCRDGSYSYSQHRNGACAWHGGIAK